MDLAEDKVTIAQLPDDVAPGKSRLQLKATCQMQSAIGASSMGNDVTARLNHSAQRDYFTPGDRIATITGQVNYLQQYIREQCLK